MKKTTITQTTYTIRKANVQDVACIAQFNIAMAGETEDTILDAQTIHNGVASLMQYPQYGFYLVAETADQVIGCLLITYEWSDWRDGLLWWIQSVYVLPNWRRKGVYKAMYSTIQNMAGNDANIAGLRLYVHSDNKNAQKTYQSLGMIKAPYQIYEWFPTQKQEQD